jgi:acyl-CoA reductase-like NAD-dependent aldehyde dehydrogenase
VATEHAASAVALRRARLLIDGSWVDGSETFPVYDKFSGALIGHADRASRQQVDDAVAAAHRSFGQSRLAPYERYTVLRRVCDLIEERRDMLARTIVAEAGFPVKWCRSRAHPARRTALRLRFGSRAEWCAGSRRSMRR